MKKALLFLFVVLVLAIIVGVVVYNVGQKQNQPAGQPAAQNSAIQSTDGEQATTTQSLPENKGCESLATAEERAACSQKTVETINAAQDVSGCESLAGAEKTVCQNSYIVKKAIAEKNLDVCGEIKEEAVATACKSQAAMSLAIQNRDKKYCENIFNKEDKENCFKILSSMGVK